MARYDASPIEADVHCRDVRTLRHRLVGWWESATWPFLAITLGYGLTVNRLVGMGCPFHDATGLDCPGCGATRACFNVLHGRVVNALHYNALAVLVGASLLPYLVLRRLGVLRVPARLRASIVARHPVMVVVTALLAWTLFRNLPAFHWFNTSWSRG